MISLCMEPTTPPKSWLKFCSESPIHSIALDGYVRGVPRFQDDGPRLNLNHHEEVDRLATRSTCAQTLISIRQGLFKTFGIDGQPVYIFANDCDEDVCLSWFLLKNHFLVESAMNPAVNRLVSLEDTMDATAGAYPFPADLPALGELAWVFEPYRRFRLSGELDKKVKESYESVIEDVESRIMKMILGHGKILPLDTRYKVIGGGPGWSMVEELGTHARTGMFSNGIHSFVSVRNRMDGMNTYVVGRMSQFIKFPVAKILDTLDKAEESENDHWGGGDVIGGSPRVKGSKLDPVTVERMINDLINLEGP